MRCARRFKQRPAGAGDTGTGQTTDTNKRIFELTLEYLWQAQT